MDIAWGLGTTFLLIAIVIVGIIVITLLAYILILLVKEIAKNLKGSKKKPNATVEKPENFRLR